MSDIEHAPRTTSVDPTLLASTLSSPPFIQVEGVFNIRDFGSSYQAAGQTATVKPLRLFRSGELSHITDRGIERLRALGIRKVFDLRVDVEISKYQSATKPIEGVDIVRAPVLQNGWDQKDVATMLQAFEENPTSTFLKGYIEVVECGRSALEQVLLHLRDHPDIPCLIHCTVGKDRTGVFAALILMLLHVQDEDIVRDYALTEIGMQPVMPMLAERFKSQPVFRDNWAGAVTMGSAKPETIQAFMDWVRREHGGAESCIKKYTSLTDDDIHRIRMNCLE